MKRVDITKALVQSVPETPKPKLLEDAQQMFLTQDWQSVTLWS